MFFVKNIIHTYFGFISLKFNSDKKRKDLIIILCQIYIFYMKCLLVIQQDF